VTEHGGGEGEVDRQRVELARDPVLYRALAFLNEHPGDRASQVARALSIDLETASAALEHLSERKAVERTPAAGGGEPGYRALTRALWTDEEVAQLSAEERQGLNAWIVEMVSADVDQALAAGTVARSSDTHMSRTVSIVDAQGWQELTQIQDEALSAIFAVQEAAAERLAERGEDGVPVLTAMFCCELPGEAQRLD